MDKDKKLIVPEINAGILSSDDKIIANPNCSTIQLVLIIAPLHSEYQIKRIVVSTYQSVTGTGVKAVQQLENERNGITREMAYLYSIDKNCIPQCDEFIENAYTREEMKLVNETQKILNDYDIRLTATAVRVPVVGGHAESVNIEFEKDFKINDVVQILTETEGVVVSDDIAHNIYPMPKYSEGRDEVFVGRIRRDHSNPNSLNMWIVADNLRKGAATNAVQIAEVLLHKEFVIYRDLDN
jgi:aspartate-semialdehyde dehydrogenase